jgi:ketosteroid isomerase-like protein
MTNAQQEVVDLEARRAAAIGRGDFEALAAVLADDYLHVYGDGNTSDRAGYLEQVKAGPRVPTRGPLKVRIYGDVAVVTGDLLNRIRYPDKPERILDTFVTQVARKVDGEWRFVSFQITPKTGS